MSGILRTDLFGCHSFLRPQVMKKPEGMILERLLPTHLSAKAQVSSISVSIKICSPSFAVSDRKSPLVVATLSQILPPIPTLEKGASVTSGGRGAAATDGSVASGLLQTQPHSSSSLSTLGQPLNQDSVRGLIKKTVVRRHVSRYEEVP